MGGTPRQLTLSLGLSQRFKVEDVDVLMLGVKDALALYNIDLVGLEVSSSYTGLTIAVTALGSVAIGEELRRSGAKKNDLLCLTGNVGAAYMGLQLLIREKVAFDGTADFAPQFDGREYILQRQMKPIARLDILRQLQATGIKPTAMIRVRDGLASDLPVSYTHLDVYKRQDKYYTFPALAQFFTNPELLNHNDPKRVLSEVGALAYSYQWSPTEPLLTTKITSFDLPLYQKQYPQAGQWLRAEGVTYQWKRGQLRSH